MRRWSTIYSSVITHDNTSCDNANTSATSATSATSVAVAEAVVSGGQWWSVCGGGRCAAVVGGVVGANTSTSCDNTSCDNANTSAVCDNISGGGCGRGRGSGGQYIVASSVMSVMSAMSATSAVVVSVRQCQHIMRHRRRWGRGYAVDSTAVVNVCIITTTSAAVG